jgi:hypothetical protein
VYQATQAAGQVRNKTFLFYHFHIPRTGGTTLANLLLGDICDPFGDQIPLNGHPDLCTKSCTAALSDNQFSCYPDRLTFEHWTFKQNFQRAEELKLATNALNVLFVTTLRRGSDRVLSQWMLEVNASLWIPPSGVETISNKSLQLYLQGASQQGAGWVANGAASMRNNLQVGVLASAPLESKAELTRDHLEAAKGVLSTGFWLIGFTGCLEQAHRSLTRYADSLHGGKIARRAMPRDASTQFSTSHGIVLNSETQAMLDAACALDNELFDWAWSMAGTDPRFTNKC